MDGGATREGGPAEPGPSSRAPAAAEAEDGTAGAGRAPGAQHGGGAAARGSGTSDEGRSAALDPRTIASSTVDDVDGRRIGRVLDVYLVDRTGQLAAVSVALGPFADHDAMIPVDLLSPGAPGRVRVAAPRDRVRTTAMPAPATAHLEPDALAEARRALTEGAAS